jgi:hypothetical protein
VALANTSFETADPANPGLADDWSLAVVSVITIAGYALGAGLEQGWDGFEVGWNADAYAFALAGGTTAAEYSAALFVTAPTFESFEAGWAPDQAFFDELGATIAAEYNASLDAFEGFDAEWGVTAFATSLAVAQTAAGTETFDTGWLTVAYATTLAVSTTAASYDGASPEAFEDFDEVIAPVVFTLNPGTDVFTSVGHPLLDGMKVRARSTGTPPGGLSTAIDWYVVNRTANTFQLAATPGGAAHDFSTQGSGVHSLVVDPSLYWTEVPS